MIYKTLHKKLTNEQYVSHALKTGVPERLAVPVPLADTRCVIIKRHDGHMIRKSLWTAAYIYVFHPKVST
jgi:hypothetical protein